MIDLNGYRMALDRREKGSDMDFVSHAHSDHVSAAKSSKRIIASDETVQLLQAIKGIDATGRLQNELPSGIRLIDANHILGSKQIVIEDERNGVKLVYTGDFQMQHSRASRRTETTSADIAVVDSTYPYPDIRFDERTAVENGIQHWVSSALKSGIVLFGTYALGKAQELIMILNEIGITPVVSKKISTVNSVYANNRIKLDYMSAYGDSGADNPFRGNFVGIVENNALDALSVSLTGFYNRKVFTAVATGMSKIYRFRTDAQFALSDHADFVQCREYLDATAAKRIFTYGPNADILSGSLRNVGYNARPLHKNESISMVAELQTQEAD
jgi:hypothetical protein